MPKSKQTAQPKQYFTNISRKLVYSCLAAFALIALALFLCVPHYKPLKLASTQQIMDAHRDIIHAYFVSETTCVNDTVDKATRVKTFNKYFAVNQYANRAVMRGCHDVDTLLAKDDSGKWQPVDIVVELDGGLPDSINNACLTRDIIKHNNLGFSDPGVMATQVPRYQRVCERLAKQSYVEVHWNQSMQFHF
ncbi:MAG TPA: hypothetical protein VN031_01980 [Candidatus Microsaccharimonas sp.]|nr:hypothetical protein [Candidatus Microsaccharimonas sp.]